MASIRALRSVFPSLAGTTTASVLFHASMSVWSMVMGLAAPDITVFFSCYGTWPWLCGCGRAVITEALDTSISVSSQIMVWYSKMD